MICGACKASVPAGSTSCPSCKRKFVVKPAAPAKPKPPAASEADDLLGPEPPPRPAAPTPAAPRFMVRGGRPTGHRAGRLRSGGSASTLTAGGIISLLVIAGIFGLRVCRVARAITGQTVVNETITIPADDAYAGAIDVEGSHTYTFEVTSLDGPLQMSFGRVAGAKPTPAEAMALMASAKDVPAGSKQTMTGSVSSGKFVWIIVNDDEKKPTRAKVSFSGR